MQPGVYSPAGVIIVTASRAPRPIKHSVHDILDLRPTAGIPVKPDCCQGLVYTPPQYGFT